MNVEKVENVPTDFQNNRKNTGRIEVYHQISTLLRHFLKNTAIFYWFPNHLLSNLEIEGNVD